MPIRILLVDDHTLVREGVRMLIESQDDLVLIGEASDAAGTLAGVERERPDVVLLDLDLGGENGLDLIRSIVAQGDETRVLGADWRPRHRGTASRAPGGCARRRREGEGGSGAALGDSQMRTRARPGSTAR